MQVSVEAKEGLERRLTITVPADTIDSAVKSRLQQLAKTQRINGFRPGKVPVSVIKKRFGTAVRQEIAGEVMQRNFYQAVMQEKLNPAGMPAFEMKSDKDGEDLEFVASFEVYPEFEVQNLDAINVEKTVVEIQEEDIDAMMQTLRTQHGKWVESEEAAAADSRVVIDFTGTIDGEEFEGGKSEDFVLEMGKSRMIPGFEDPIVGKKAGDELVAEVTFPEEYHAENLKGKDAKFAITLKKVEVQELPEINEEFAKLFGVEDGSVEALRAEVTRNMQRELDQTLRAQLKEQVISGLVENNPVDLPEALVKQEIEALKRQAQQRFGGNVPAENMPELPDDLFADNAKKRVSIGLILGEVIKSKDLQVDQEKVDALIETNASAYEDPQEVISYYKSNQELMQQMQNLALEDQAIDIILEEANVTEVAKKFDEVMNKTA
ncbi:trigger factor [Planctobacterium marinum]|uniref:Trigger factor n=1 Tax=Planctobacterium marinum TaxID=1631968 RepID=A0AA48HNE6_9ALTE|nr:trigger factor [Planctobacterium marinum]